MASNKMKEINIGVLASVISLLASVAAPILYVGSIKEVNATQQLQINQNKDDIKENDSDIKNLNAKIDALLWRNGIDPNKVSGLTQANE